MNSGSILFFSGAAMLPQSVRAAYPEARFIARAHLLAQQAEIAPAFARRLVDRGESATVWGIAVQIPAALDAPTRAATTDEGHALDVVIAETPLAGGDPETALNAALYWELPPEYTGQLREAAGVEAPAPEGGWETTPLEDDRGTPNV